MSADEGCEQDLAGSTVNFIGTMLFGPPYTGTRTALAAMIVDPDFKEATIQNYGLEVQCQH
jgi:hypothetical protein